MEDKNKDIIEYGELFNSIIKFNRLKNIVEIGVVFGNTTLELTTLINLDTLIKSCWYDNRFADSCVM